MPEEISRSTVTRSAIVTLFIIIASMTVSVAGLTNIIKYGYGYCGYLAIAIIIVPFLTIGRYKTNAMPLTVNTAPASTP